MISSSVFTGRKRRPQAIVRMELVTSCRHHRCGLIITIVIARAIGEYQYVYFFYADVYIIIILTAYFNNSDNI